MLIADGGAENVSFGLGVRELGVIIIRDGSGRKACGVNFHEAFSISNNVFRELSGIPDTSETLVKVLDVVFSAGALVEAS